MDQDPLVTLICIGQIPPSQSVAHWKCVTPPVRLNTMYKNSRRHLALVLNKDDDTIKFYLDGELAGTLSSETGEDNAWIRDTTMFDTDGDGKGDYHGGGVGRLDCGLNTADGYTALGHRVALGGERP